MTRVAGEGGDSATTLGASHILAVMGRVSFLFVFVVIAVAVVAVAVGLLVAWRRRTVRARVIPLCGGCGYHLAPNPMGLTVCPECGGDFLSVGILAPNMKLGRRGSPAVPLGIAWFIFVGVGMVPLHKQFAVAFTRMLNTTNVTQTSSGNGPFKGIAVNARRDQISDEKQADRLTANVTIKGADGKDLVIVVDGLTKTISDAPASSGLKGMPWDTATARKIISATGGGDTPDDESAAKMRSIVDDALTKTDNGGPLLTFGSPLSRRGGFSSSSTSGFSTFRRGSGGYSETGTSSSFSGSTAPVVIIGPLRGDHWLIILSCVTGLLLAFGGLWVIVLLTRQRGGGEAAIKLPSA